MWQLHIRESGAVGGVSNVWRATPIRASKTQGQSKDVCNGSRQLQGWRSFGVSFKDRYGLVGQNLKTNDLKVV